MRKTHWTLLVIATIGAALGGCAGGANYTQSAPGHPVHYEALADEVYLDGTGPSARRQAVTPRRVVRSRPADTPPAVNRADSISASTTGTRASASNESQKPFSDQWWEKESREDARLKARMNICRGC